MRESFVFFSLLLVICDFFVRFFQPVFDSNEIRTFHKRSLQKLTLFHGMLLEAESSSANYPNVTSILGWTLHVPYVRFSVIHGVILVSLKKRTESCIFGLPTA